MMKEIKTMYYEYVMTKAMANDLLNNRTGDDKKMNPADYLIKVVNNEFGVLGICSKVSII